MSHPVAAFALALVASATLAAPTFAHNGHEIGDYILAIGWLREPAYVGQPNAVQVTITDHDDGTPITDLGDDALTVVVSTAGVMTPTLVLEPAFDAVEKTGPLGEYDAPIVPTAPGDYEFHFSGSIKGTAVDLTVASGEETFEPVVASTGLEFPVKMPTLTEVGTRLDRIDGRIEGLQSADPGEGIAALQTAQEAVTRANNAQSAADAANRNAQLGFFVGMIGILLALRARRATKPPSAPG